MGIKKSIMENMVNMNSLFGGIYKDKKVLITGHTGFKGSWLSQWLKLCGAEVYGYSLNPPSVPNHFDLLKPDVNSHTGDVRDLSALQNFFRKVKPDIVFHLAAQALVRPSYNDPVETFTTNITGTVNVLEACRKTDSIKAVINVTSDKCYENKDWLWGYRENDPMGGFDPYSASKGCSELVTASYRNSFFNLKQHGKSHNILLASARAGNVIGGGDWATDRLIPDMIKAAASKLPMIIRNPESTRPWQHVLEPLSGYLMLGWKLLENKMEFADGWNFGPDLKSNLSVNEVVGISKNFWEEIKIEYSDDISNQHEANVLMLDCSKARKLLKWEPLWEIEKTLKKTVDWYKNYYRHGKILTLTDIADYVNDSSEKKLSWAV